MAKTNKAAEELPDSVFNRLSQVDVNEKTETKNNLTYLSWAWAFAEVFKRFPDTTYEVKDHTNTYIEPQENGSFAMYQAVEPFLFNPHLGYMITTSVTIDGVTKTMQLPVMDGANKAQKHVVYTYEGWDWVLKPGANKKEKVRVNKVVEPATMFDINTSIMRCLVKNFAMHGLGHYIYAGEDLPEDISDMIVKTLAETKKELETAKTTTKPVETPKEEPKPEPKVEPEVKAEAPAKEKAKVTPKPKTKPVDRPDEMPDDSAVLASEPLAEADKQAKAISKEQLADKFKSATTHDEAFAILSKLDALKVLATGTMHFNWKFKSIDELKEKMRPADLEVVITRLCDLARHYNPA